MSLAESSLSSHLNLKKIYRKGIRIGGPMTAKLIDKNGVLIVNIGGTLDIEYTQPFKEACLRQFSSKKIIFNMEKANFVGSTGLQSFIETLQGLSQGQHGVKVTGVKTEFRRIFQNLELQRLEIFESDDSAVASFLLSDIH